MKQLEKILTSFSITTRQNLRPGFHLYWMATLLDVNFGAGSLIFPPWMESKPAFLSEINILSGVHCCPN